MKRVLRAVLVASTLAVPFVVLGPSTPASATCRPEKPSTCQPYCPFGSYVYVGPYAFCAPVPET